MIKIISGIPGAESETVHFRRTEDGIYEWIKENVEKVCLPISIEIGMTWVDAYGQKCQVESKETLNLIDRKYEKCLEVSRENKDEKLKIIE